jgi:excisionase family DNA binding protein
MILRTSPDERKHGVEFLPAPCPHCTGQLFVDATGDRPETVCLDCDSFVPVGVGLQGDTPDSDGDFAPATAYLNPKQVAARLFVTADHVRRLVRQGKLPAERHGRDIRIPLSAIPAAA